MVGELLVALVDDVEVALFVDGDVVRGLPAVLVGQFWPVVFDLITVFSAADDVLADGLGQTGGNLRQRRTPL